MTKNSWNEMNQFDKPLFGSELNCLTPSNNFLAWTLVLRICADLRCLLSIVRYLGSAAFWKKIHMSIEIWIELFISQFHVINFTFWLITYIWNWQIMMISTDIKVRICWINCSQTRRSFDWIIRFWSWGFL